MNLKGMAEGSSKVRDQAANFILHHWFTVHLCFLLFFHLDKKDTWIAQNFETLLWSVMPTDTLTIKIKRRYIFHTSFDYL